MNVYVDESKPTRECPWLYIGALILPTERIDGAVALLDADREAVGYGNEMHFQNVKSVQKRALAVSWLDHVLHGRDRVFHYSLLGVDQRRLDHRRFGRDSKTQRQQMYARLFRTAVSGAIKWMAGPGRKPVVSQLVHDRSEMESHDVFAWHAQWKMAQGGDIEFEQSSITFEDSDHRVAEDEKSSHLIQLCDIATGAFRQCVEATSQQEAKMLLGEHVVPLVSRIMDPNLRFNKNSRYDHWRRVRTGFFPNGREDGANEFYSARKISILESGKAGAQGRLFDVP